MGSRVGSIAILMVIAGIVAAVVIVISRLDLLDTGEPDAPVMVVSLDEGELVLLNEPQSITVTISSGNPIATLELFVDERSIVSILPAYSADRGAWIGSFVWTPERLGFADIRIVALDDQGVESQRNIRVEVTDDQARVAAALRVQVLGITPLQQFIAGTEIPLNISATGSQPIERFDMLVNDEHAISVTPVLDNSGRYSANIDWTPYETGEVQVTIVAVDAAGRRESHTVPIIILPQDGSSPSSETGSSTDQPAQAETPTAAEPAAGGVGVARIDFPRDGQQFTLDSGFALDVELSAQNVGEVASALLYITPIAPDNTLGKSVLIHSSEDHGPGDYSERLTDVERWITGSGSYELQLVIFTPDDERYDDRIMIHIVAVADEEEEPNGEPATSDQIDLAVVTARQADDDRNRLNVTITNQSTVDIERTEILITVVDAADGAELSSAAVTLGIESDALRTIPLDLELEPDVEVAALVLLEAAVDTDTSNNTFAITLAPPDSQQLQEAQQEVQQEATLQEESDRQDQQAQAEPEPAGPSPDLTFLDIQATNDGYVLLTVINSGEGAADTFTIVISNQDGETLETISRREGDAQPLGPNETEILTSLQAHAGVIVITVLVGGEQVDQEVGNNRVTLDLDG